MTRDEGELASLAQGRVGTVLAGKYRVERVLGAGGMGVVVAAHHIGLNTKVAIKFLLPEMLRSREIVARFAREAQAAVRITNEHVARVFDVGTLETGAPYMVMEYLDGGDLDGWLKQRGALPIEQAVEFVLQACIAVAEAHGLGIVHRDLKPANLFCVRRSDGQLSIKVLDFGISKMTGVGGMDSSGMGVTRTSAMLGTPLYMSPEHLKSSKTADAQSDIWSLGVILFELLAGKVPFDAESVADLAVKLATEPPSSLRGFRPDVPAGLEAIVFKCLERDKARRYRNVAQLAVALLPFAPTRARASVERISGISQASGLSLSYVDSPPTPRDQKEDFAARTLLTGGRTTGGLRGNKKAAVGVILGGTVGLAIVVGGVMFWKGGTHGDVSQGIVAQGVSQPVASASANPVPTVSAASAPPPTGSPSATPVVDTAALPLAPVVNPPTSRPPPRSAAPSPARVAPVKAAPARSNCDPPYALDKQGHKLFKPECF